MEEKFKEYNNSEILVTTQWVEDHIKDFADQKGDYRLVESNEDPLLYHSKHIPNAVEIDWTSDLNDPVTRDYINEKQFEELCSKKGISTDTTVVFYGDKNNWWSAYALWVFQLFGHEKVKLMDGGRIKWEKENRKLVKEIPELPKAIYKSKIRNDKTVRVFRDDVLAAIKLNIGLVDVRSPEEFRGERLHIPGYPNEGALRGGHIPGAHSIPWASSIQEDGSFKPLKDLKKIYENENNLSKKQPVITYCRIGERSSHTWFVLKYLLGFENVKNYDGSWTEYGNLVGAPIEK